MSRVGRDVNRPSGLHFYDPVLKLEPGGTCQNYDPLMIGLVIPKAFWRFVARRDDPFDPDAVALLKNGGEFFGQVLGEVGEEVHWVGTEMPLRSGGLRQVTLVNTKHLGGIHASKLPVGTTNNGH